jgi:hypothetical protein
MYRKEVRTPQAGFACETTDYISRHPCRFYRLLSLELRFRRRSQNLSKPHLCRNNTPGCSDVNIDEFFELKKYEDISILAVKRLGSRISAKRQQPQQFAGQKNLRRN